MLILDKDNILVTIRIMAKVTSKLQVTIPKRLAAHFNIHPGDDIEWVPTSDAIRMIPQRAFTEGLPSDERLKLFDEATKRQQQREQNSLSNPISSTAERGWSRTELYDRDCSN
jgi:AbrB family looped-hinge helix DNA binding protein